MQLEAEAATIVDPDERAEMLEGFASQAALALENAALVEGLRTSYRDLSRARSEAVRAESLRALGRMATEVAHDLNNLGTALVGPILPMVVRSRLPDHLVGGTSAYAAGTTIGAALAVAVAEVLDGDRGPVQVGRFRRARRVSARDTRKSIASHRLRA